MSMDAQIKSRTLLGVTDLTLVAKIKQGLIPALDSRSYVTRLRLLLKTLSAFRSSQLEIQPRALLGDVIDEIRAIHSFRLAIIDEDQLEPKLVLAVAFDGGWEPYMRRIWRDLGPFLDVIFCNCEGYLTAADHSFAEYTSWIRSAQVETQFFHNASALTVNDLHYLRRVAAADVARSEPAERPQEGTGEGDVVRQSLPRSRPCTGSRMSIRPLPRLERRTPATGGTFGERRGACCRDLPVSLTLQHRRVNRRPLSWRR